MEKYFRYLDDLRDSGVTNMWGAPAYLVAVFGLSNKEARKVWAAWIKEKEKASEAR